MVGSLIRVGPAKPEGLHRLVPRARYGHTHTNTHIVKVLALGAGFCTNQLLYFSTLQPDSAFSSLHCLQVWLQSIKCWRLNGQHLMRRANSFAPTDLVVSDCYASYLCLRHILLASCLVLTVQEAVNMAGNNLLSFTEGGENLFSCFFFYFVLPLCVWEV